MAENPELTAVRGIYDSLAKGDLDHISTSLLSDDVVFHVPGRGGLAGDHRGKDQVMSYLSKMIEAGTVRFQPSDLLIGAEHVAVVLDVQGEKDGRRLDERGMQLFRLTDGKISERWSYPPDPDATDEFFA